MKADLAPLLTLRQCSIISSSSTSLVSSMPRATIARLSPTSTMSMPAWSATCADGKSCAVRTVIGSFFLYMLAMVWRVIFLRVEVVLEPNGEWDERRTWEVWSKRGASCGREDTFSGLVAT